MGTDSFEQRVARNEAAFRAVNEGVERGRVGAETDMRVGFVCECGHPDCHRLVDLTPAEYEAVRRNPRRFFIVDGHEIPETERVVERHDRYSVVEKHEGPPAAIAERLDPRS